MTDEEFKKIVDGQNAKLDAIYKSSERTRLYFKWTLIISIAVIVLPLIGLLFLVPQLLSTYSSLMAF